MSNEDSASCPAADRRIVGRPGQGGRLVHASPFTPTSATADLIAEYGPPLNETRDRVQLLIWRIDPGGDGILLGRLSGRELQGGETALGQIHPLRSLAARFGLAPRLIVVSVNNSGTRRYENRPDFALVSAAIAEGWCSWVAWHRPDRVARDVLPAEMFYDHLRRDGVRLYLGDLGRAVDWSADRLHLRALGLISAEEAAAIAERTHGAIRTRYPGEGRGWPSSRRFGFRRNWATKYPEVDPEQWEFVKRIHLRYAQMGKNAGGVRCLRDELARLGCDLSHEQIRAILRDPIYMTGQYTSNVDGVAVAQRPIPIDDPVPATVFQLNQELLALRRGRETTTRPGEFCLNGVTVTHAACAALEDDRGLRPLLKGRVLRETVYSYRHSPWVPTPCRGYVIPRSDLEEPVLHALREQVELIPHLRDAWDQRPTPTSGLGSQRIMPPSALRALRQRIRQRELQKVQLTRSYLARLDAGQPAHELAYWDLVGALADEIAQLRLRLATSAAAPALGAVAPDELVATLRRVLTDTVPDDDGVRIQRAALVQALVCEIQLVDRSDGSIQADVVTPFTDMR